MPDWMLIPFQYFVCMVMHFVASSWWQIDQALLLGAVMFHYFRRWLQNDILDFTVNLIFQPGDGNFLMAYIAGALGLAILLGGAFLVHPFQPGGLSPRRLLDRADRLDLHQPQFDLS